MQNGLSKQWITTTIGSHLGIMIECLVSTSMHGNWIFALDFQMKYTCIMLHKVYLRTILKFVTCDHDHYAYNTNLSRMNKVYMYCSLIQLRVYINNETVTCMYKSCMLLPFVHHKFTFHGQSLIAK